MDSYGIALISDVHIKRYQDEAYDLLMSFFHHPTVKSSTAIYLLGDIFDCMVGRQQEYLERYAEYFKCIASFLCQGKEVSYFQGNHDVHVELNYRDYFHHHQIPDERFFYHSRPLIKRLWGKVFFFAHGDEIELGNWGYKIYKSIITTSVAKFLAENIVGHDIIHRIAEPASEHSRSRGAKCNNLMQVQKNFREAAIKTAIDKQCNYIICGHSHIKDDYDHLGRFNYINNGYALESGTFIHLENGVHSFVAL